MKTNYFILIAFLLAITFTNVASQSDGRVYCDPKPADFDPTQVVCTLEFNPVCGYSNSSDSEGSSGSNPCFACAQEGVDYYIEGACPGENGESGETENGEGGNNEEESLIIYCQVPDPFATDIACTLEYDPVCAYHFNDDGTSSGTTIGNSCQACQQDGYDFYIKGACSDDGNGEGETGGETGGDNGEGNDNLIQCPTIDLSATDVICTLQYEPVCAYQANDTNLANGVTVGNACQACQQQGYSFYIDGACEDDGANDEEIILNEELYPNGGVAVVCELPDLSATDIACVEVYEPVCAYFFNDTNEANGVTISNACHACLLQGFDFYVQGECPNNNSTEVVEEEQFPVEEQQQQGAGNEAGTGTSSSATSRCENPGQASADAICTLEYAPVCAYRDSNPDAGTTIGNSCQACSQDGYDYYISGACEDQS